jgi:alpha-ribazole phosphatase/probable phosphoglycerate mutase
MSAPVRLVLIRHAQPSDEVRGRCYGSLDVGLSPAGARQARALARTLAPVAPAALYSSPSIRAQRTAAPLAAACGLEAVMLEDAREIDFGAFEGRRWDEIARSHPQVFDRWMTAPTRVRFPSGESYALMRRRALRAMAALVDRHAGETAALVSHGGVLRAMLAACLRMPAAAAFRLDLAYASISVIEWIDATPIVRLAGAPAGSSLTAAGGPLAATAGPGAAP